MPRFLLRVAEVEQDLVTVVVEGREILCLDLEAEVVLDLEMVEVGVQKIVFVQRTEVEL